MRATPSGWASRWAKASIAVRWRERAGGRSIQEYRVDDRLHCAGHSRRTEREQPFVDAVLHRLFGHHVLEDVDAVHRQQDLVDVEGLLRVFGWQHLQRPGVGADHGHAQRREPGCAVNAQAGFDRAVALVVLADEPGPAGVEDHHVALADRCDVLALQGRLDLLAIEGRSFGHRVLAGEAHHVEDHAARGNGRHLLDAELLQAGRGDDLAALQAVVVHAVDAEVAQAIDLRADAHPARDDVVVVAGLRLADGAAVFLAGRHHGEGKEARRVGRRLAVGFDGHADGLAALDELDCREGVGGGDVVHRPTLVVGPPLGLVATLQRLALRARGQQHGRNGKHRLDRIHSVAPWRVARDFCRCARVSSTAPAVSIDSARFVPLASAGLSEPCETPPCVARAGC